MTTFKDSVLFPEEKFNRHQIRIIENQLAPAAKKAKHLKRAQRIVNRWGKKYVNLKLQYRPLRII